MRIISGEARGRKLKPVSGDAVRPTSARVKEAMFNILQFHIEGRCVLDLFSGTGQLGVEALSRGARECTFIEQSAAAVSVISENTKGFGSKAKIYTAEALRWLEHTDGSYDIIILDPPYHQNFAKKTLLKIFERDILNLGGFIICETERDAPLPPNPEPPYHFKKTYNYGSKILVLYEKLINKG